MAKKLAKRAVKRAVRTPSRRTRTLAPTAIDPAPAPTPTVAYTFTFPCASAEPFTRCFPVVDGCYALPDLTCAHCHSPLHAELVDPVLPEPTVE